MKKAIRLLAVATALTILTAFAGPGRRGPEPIPRDTNVLHTNITSTLGPLREYDTDGDGTITTNELNAASALFAQTRLTNFLVKYDGNSDGVISSNEVLAVTQAAAERWVTNVLAHYDCNSDGSLSTNEVHRFHGRGDPSIADLDVDRDGVISNAELVAGGVALAEERQAEILETYDTNKDGNITSAEALAVFQAEADERASDILDRFDANDDGSITAEEIAAVLPPFHGRGDEPRRR